MHGQNSITALVLFMRIERKRSGCVGIIKRQRSVCVGITKRFGNVACDVNVTHTLRVLLLTATGADTGFFKRGVETRDTKCGGGGGGVLSALDPTRKAGGGCCPL